MHVQIVPTQERGRVGAPFSILEMFQLELAEPLEEVKDRLYEELRTLPLASELAGHWISQMQFWSAATILAFAKRHGEIRPGHIDVAVTIELLFVVFNFHAPNAQLQRARDAAIGEHILVGDFYLTRASANALKSNRIQTLTSIATIMRCLPESLLMAMERPEDPVTAYRLYRRRHEIGCDQVILHCLLASLSESEKELDRGVLKGLSSALSRNFRATLEWNSWSQPRIDMLPEWDLPAFIAYGRSSATERREIADALASPQPCSNVRLNELFNNTKAIHTCAAYASRCGNRAVSKIYRLMKQETAFSPTRYSPELLATHA